MRILLFLAALGVVMAGGMLNDKNPAASVFEIAAGRIGYKIFGIVLWSAAITSVVGSAYTSVSFIKVFILARAKPALVDYRFYTDINSCICHAETG